MTTRVSTCFLLAALVTLPGCFSWVCDATTCADGCCTTDGTGASICAIGGTQDKCGVNAEQCQVCGSADLCQAGKCVSKCSAATCPDGCCDGNTHQCIKATSQSGNTCGGAGVKCFSCLGNASGSSCALGKCCLPKGQTCNPNVNTCCNAATCVPTSATSGFCQ